MCAQRRYHAVAGHRGGAAAHRRRAALAIAALALPLAAGFTAAPAWAAGGYTVTATIPVGAAPYGMGVDPVARTAYVTNSNDDTVSVIDVATNPDGTIQAANGKCLDIYREQKTNNAPVELWTCTGRANQQWKLP